MPSCNYAPCTLHALLSLRCASDATACKPASITIRLSRSLPISKLRASTSLCPTDPWPVHRDTAFDTEFREHSFLLELQRQRLGTCNRRSHLAQSYDVFSRSDGQPLKSATSPNHGAHLQGQSLSEVLGADDLSECDLRLVLVRQDAGTGLPVQVVPHDALRQGLAALKQHAEVSHPVEAIQDNVGRA